MHCVADGAVMFDAEAETEHPDPDAGGDRLVGQGLPPSSGYRGRDRPREEGWPPPVSDP